MTSSGKLNSKRLESIRKMHERTHWYHPVRALLRHIDATAPYTIERFKDIDTLPVGAIIRAERWGTVAVKVHERRWKGSIPPSGDQLIDPDPEMFEDDIHWAVAGSVGQLVSCDGPFLVLHVPENGDRS